MAVFDLGAKEELEVTPEQDHKILDDWDSNLGDQEEENKKQETSLQYRGCKGCRTLLQSLCIACYNHRCSLASTVGIRPTET